MREKLLQKKIIFLFLFSSFTLGPGVFAEKVKEKGEPEKLSVQESYQLGTTQANYTPEFISECEKRYYGRPEVHFVLKLLELKEGMSAGDIGCGVGSFTFPIAIAVGKSGKVYAVDIQEKMIEVVKRHILDKEQNPFDNITAYVSRNDNASIPDNSLDVAWLSMVHFHNFPVLYKENLDMIKSVYDSLKPGARLIIADEVDEPGYIKNPAPNIIRHYRNAGFILLKGPFRDPVIKTSFYLVFKKPNHKPKL